MEKPCHSPNCNIQLFQGLFNYISLKNTWHNKSIKALNEYGFVLNGRQCRVFWCHNPDWRTNVVIASAVCSKTISSQLALFQRRLILPLQEQALESQLSDTRVALERALSERERLLLEIQKYDPTFTLWASEACDDQDGIRQTSKICCDIWYL